MNLEYVHPSFNCVRATSARRPIVAVDVHVIPELREISHGESYTVVSWVFVAGKYV
jgi:hypothetical protein